MIMLFGIIFEFDLQLRPIIHGDEYDNQKNG